MSDLKDDFVEHERAPKWFYDLCVIINGKSVDDAWNEFSYRGDLSGGTENGKGFRWDWEGHSFGDYDMWISWDD